MERLLDQTRSFSIRRIKSNLEDEALRIYKGLTDQSKIGENGRLIKDGDGVLTHCNAGLATAGFRRPWESFNQLGRGNASMSLL
jgi:methylthioribose-1-phosphate isomerase